MVSLTLGRRMSWSRSSKIPIVLDLTSGSSEMKYYFLLIEGHTVHYLSMSTSRSTILRSYLKSMGQLHQVPLLALAVLIVVIE